MRTTVTLDEDVERLLREAMHRTHKSFKESLNQAVRAGLAGSAAGLEPFVVRARPLGLRAGVDPGRLNQLGDELEVEAAIARMRRTEAAERRRQARTVARPARRKR